MSAVRWPLADCDGWEACARLLANSLVVRLRREGSESSSSPSAAVYSSECERGWALGLCVLAAVFRPWMLVSGPCSQSNSTRGLQQVHEGSELPGQVVPNSSSFQHDFCFEDSGCLGFRASGNLASFLVQSLCRRSWLEEFRLKDVHGV